MGFLCLMDREAANGSRGIWAFEGIDEVRRERDGEAEAASGFSDARTVLAAEWRGLGGGGVFGSGALAAGV